MAKNTVSEPKRVTVEIHGVEYPLRTVESEEYVKSLAKMVDERMGDVESHTGSFSVTRIAVLTALEFADQYMKLKKEYDDLMSMIDDK